MTLTPFKETYENEVHHFNNGDIVTDIACEKRFVAHVDDDCPELKAIRNIFKGLRLESQKFFVEAVFKEIDESPSFSDRLIVQVKYGMNGGTPADSTHEAKWVWYVDRIAGIMSQLLGAGFGCPSLRFVHDLCMNDIYWCWIACTNVKGGIGSGDANGNREG